MDQGIFQKFGKLFSYLTALQFTVFWHWARLNVGPTRCQKFALRMVDKIYGLV